LASKDIIQKCPIDNLREAYTKFTKKINDVIDVASKLEENMFGQEIFGSRSEEDIEVVKVALEVAEDYLAELDEEQSTLSKCLELQQIEWEENVAKCNVETPDDCDKVKAFLDEIKEMRGRK